MLILVQPTTLSRDDSLRAAFGVLQAKGITVARNWFVDADIVLKVDDQDVQRATAALTEAGFVAVVQSKDART